MPKAAYHLTHPERRTTSVVFASPHSGRDYPWTFLRRTALNEHSVRSSEDAFVDQLFDCAPRAGAPFLKAGAPRAYVDLNRSADELDPALIEGVSRQGHNPRVASGLGVIPRVVANGQSIYTGKLTRGEAERRIVQYWHPYHAALRSQLDQAFAQFGEAILFDCHSMPHEAVEAISKRGKTRPQVVLGDRFGASASVDVVDQVESAFVRAGLSVTRNSPFAGAYVAQSYGRPARNRHALQIEIDRSLYMDERTVLPNNNFADFQILMRSILAELIEIGRPGEQTLAAE